MHDATSSLSKSPSPSGGGQGGGSRIAIAAAPVSFGAFEVTVGDPGVPDPSYVLDAVSTEGYDGIDLGPLGYLGDKRDLGDRLRGHGLRLAGGFMPMPFSDPAGMPPAMAELERLLDVLDSVTAPTLPSPRRGGVLAPSLRGGGVLAPKPTLADAGSAARRASPGQAQQNRALGLEPEAWERFAGSVQQAADYCRSRNYDPTFHHHAGTYVEAPWEIEELLERTDVGLCLDTGHLVLGGGEPVEAVGKWGARINHVHLKDIRRSVITDVIREGAGMMDVWRRGAFCRLGAGDLDIDAILVALLGRGYQGWLVIEQDVIPGPEATGDAAGDQDWNRAFLRQRGL